MNDEPLMPEPSAQDIKLKKWQEKQRRKQLLLTKIFSGPENYTPIVSKAITTILLCTVIYFLFFTFQSLKNAI